MKRNRDGRRVRKERGRQGEEDIETWKKLDKRWETGKEWKRKTKGGRRIKKGNKKTRGFEDE